MKKIYYFFTLLLCLFLLSACKTSQPENNTAKPMNSISQFDSAVKSSRDKLNEVEDTFGQGTSWEVVGINWGAPVMNEYEFRLKINTTPPLNQASFNQIKDKAKPFTDKLLEEMKRVRVENPAVILKIVDNNANEFKGSENLKTEYRLTLK